MVEVNVENASGASPAAVASAEAAATAGVITGGVVFNPSDQLHDLQFSVHSTPSWLRPHLSSGNPCLFTELPGNASFYNYGIFSSDSIDLYGWQICRQSRTREMAEIWAGAAAGVAVQQAWDMIKRVAGRHRRFKTQYKRLGKALKRLGPILDKLPADWELDSLPREIRRGGELISNCAQVPCWKVGEEVIYFRRLQELEEAIQEFIQTGPLRGVLALSRKMEEINCKLDQLLGGGEVAGIGSGDSVAALPPLRGKVFGIEKPLVELKGMLGRHQVVGVCGMGGCGKTTLVNMLCRDRDIEGLFGKNIFYFTLSRSSDTLDLLREIWSKLFVGAVPRFKDVEDAVRKVADGLTKQRINYSGNDLIILDNVWSEKDLKDLLFRTERLKTLVISRDKVKGNIVDEIYPLPKLEEEAAKQLFYHAAGKSSPIYYEAAEQIIKRCDGLPLALEHIGRRLNGQPIERWNGITEDLLNAGDIYKSEEDLFKCFSTTIGSLCKPLRDCFLDMGFFPEDRRFSAASIIDMWAELYGLTEEEAFLKLFELSEKHLLDLTWRTRSHTIDGGNYHDLIVSQHGLLRGLALHCWTLNGCTERKRLAINGKEDGVSGSQNHDAEIVSWQGCEADYSTWSNTDFRDAKALVLNFSAGTYEHLPPFLWSMENLRTLIITNHSLDQAKITKLQTGRSYLRNLRRMRLERVSVSGLFEIEDPLLQCLEKLSLFFCQFSQPTSDSTPKNIKYPLLQSLQKLPFFYQFSQPSSDSTPKNVSSSMFPELKQLEIHYAADLVHLPSAVCETRKLQKLSITTCPDLKSLPQRLNQLTNLEYLNLYACSSLEGLLPESICDFKKLRVLDLCNCSMIEVLPENLGCLSSLARIDMRHCSKINKLPESVVQLGALQLVICDEEAKQLWDAVKRVTAFTSLQVYAPKEETNLSFLL